MRKGFLNTLVLFTIIIVSLFLLSFVAYKASVTSFTHDESFTYLNYVPQKFMDILSFQKANTNNHILNTIFIHLAEKVAGSSELTLRFPNIFFFLVYILFSYLILTYGEKLLLAPGFILLTFNPFLLDFFGLARGYGISIGCMFFSLYFLIHYFKSRKKRDILIFHLGALLASLANFTMLNFYVAGLATFNLILFLENRISNNKSNTIRYFLQMNLSNLLAILVSIAVLFEPVRKLGKYLTLDFGSKNSIWDTLTSQVYNTLYNIPISGKTETFLTWLILLILVINFTLILKNIVIPEYGFIQNHKFLIAANSITVIILLASIVQHYIFGYDYLKDRFALFFYPLIMLNFILLMNYLAEFKIRNAVFFVGFLLIPLFTVNMAKNMNTRFYKDWKYDMDTKKMLTFLQTKSTEQTAPLMLGVNWIFEPTINFYQTTKNLYWLAPVSREGISGNEDYFYVLKEELPEYSEILFTSPDGKSALYRK